MRQQKFSGGLHVTGSGRSVIGGRGQQGDRGEIFGVVLALWSTSI